MAFKVDQSKVTRKAAEEASKSSYEGKTSMLYWKPRAGDNTIRVLPPWTDQGVNAYQFWREIYVHWGVGPDEDQAQHLSCPRATPGDHADKACPVCDEYDRLRGSSDPSDKEAAKAMRVKQRSYSNIIDLADPLWKKTDIEEMKANGVKDENLPKVGTAKVQVFSYGPTILKQLIDIYTDKVDFCDLISGYNIKINKSGKDINTEYRVRTDLEAGKCKAPCKGEPPLWNLDELMPFRPAVEMQAILEGVDAKSAREIGEKAKVEQAQRLLEAKAGGAKPTPAPAKPAPAKAAPKKEPEPEPDPEPAEEVEEAAAEEPEAEAQEEVEAPSWLVEGEVVTPEGYPPCWSKELDEDDATCNSGCDAFEECRAATAYLAQKAAEEEARKEAEAAAAEAAKKKRLAGKAAAPAPAAPRLAGKPVKAAPAPAPAKPAPRLAGKAAKPVAPPPEDESPEDALEREMQEALNS